MPLFLLIAALFGNFIIQVFVIFGDEIEDDGRLSMNPPFHQSSR